MKNNTKGFTLIELIVVMSIIAILAIIALAYFRGQIFKGKDARRKADIQRIQVAVEEYEKDHNCYPLSQTVTCNPGTGLTPYLNKIPCDPSTNASYYYEYQDSVCPSWYRIYAKFENHLDSATVGWIGPNSAFDYIATSPNAPANTAGTSGVTTPPPGGTPQPTGTGVPSSFYGCQNSACVPILWDPARPGPECDPNYQNSSCYGQCGLPGNDCTPWK
ncbi:MAG: prepilin-type N-terminal cleavage/methylation domain-containing protein [Candidatus Woesebacteria bacterium]|nr:MAG: prepilin-type N-terminal cleavage/methylation domain-containing protein [Candidatus Woesebacteria bacterium]